ncbi:class III extradiol dioxygenase subunit B-like domain-containing protein [Streptomyces sp. NPDC006553]|uniref:class III extradiol dioxygenase subunit B-like domain-containing protein n=1 Tax=unclassified Streptomyces TaxID=2593676 RepID=UPI00225A3933|nr:class III extradiol dioxygenase subunit B-like domain-containing protein [Streptomyces sp. NBC_00233]MCX5229145.1 class III extradiol dioxygenase subunit B-like domain-containing protein [Streptomyces sp. NBC_00233]
MLVAAAVCPCPPLLVPEVATGAAPELDAARAACTDVVGLLAAARPDRLYVVGPADEGAHGVFPGGSTGSFTGFGVDLSVRLGDSVPPGGGPAAPGGGPADDGEGRPAADRPLPASLAVGAWLLGRAAWADAPIEGLGVDPTATPDVCAGIGRGLADSAERVALLVMGDGSACRTVKAPGYLDERAAGFDAEAARALGTADAAALLALEPELAYELKAAGRAPWQVLAGAAESADLDGRLLFEDAPYGVGYFVAAWS